MMKKLKFAIAAVVIAVGVIGVFAFSNANTEVKDSEVEPQQTQYFVTGKTTSHYLVSTNPADALDCEGDEIEPCRISSSADASGGQMAIGDVNNPSLTTIEDWTESLP